MDRLGFSILLFPALAACSANVVGQDTADADTTAVAAVVVVEQSSGPGEATHTESFARFLRTHGGIDDTARAMVGATLDMPAVGACKAIAPGEGSAPSRPLELLNVGSLSLDGRGSHAALVPRRVPDVVDLVSGVVYTTREAPTFGDKVTLKAGGSPDFDAFSLTVDAPPTLEALRINGLDPTNGVVLGLGTQRVDVSWVPSSDLVYIDLAAGKAPPSMRCAFKDDGVASVPLLGDDNTLSIHRVRQDSLHVRGIDEGAVRFDTSRVAAVTRR